MKSAFAAAVLGTALFCSHSVSAQTTAPRTAPQLGQWSVTPFAGADFNAGGDFTKTASGTSTRFGRSIPVTASSKKFSDLYDTPIMGGVSVGYGISNQGEVFGSLSYEHASGKSATDGTATISGTTVASSLKPDDLKQFNFEIGYRHFIETATPLVPYVAGSVGAARVSKINGTFTTPRFTGTFSFYDASTIAVIGLSAGITYRIGPGAAIGVEAGIRYNSSLSGDEPLGFQASGDRWTAPLLATGRVTF